MKKKNYKFIDLFAGIGGIRRGFELTQRTKCILSAEIDKYACQTYKHLYGEDPYNDVTSEEFKNKVKDNPYDILLGGFPCQAFSIAGKQHGFKDKTRGTLFFDIADILNRTKPKAFLLENVEGLIRHKKGETFNVIIETLVNELNYKVIGVSEGNGKLIYDGKTFLLNSKNFGVPQNRPRVYLMGFNKEYFGDKIKLLKNIELPKKSSKKLYKNLNELLEFKSDPKYYLSSGYLETLKKHKDRHKSKKNGFGYIVVNQKDIKEPISNALLATGGSGRERNLVFDIQKDIPGKEVKNKQTPLNEECIRTMTPIEWGKLQGFINYGFKDKKGNDHFSIPPGMSDIQLYKQFGNSVTIPVIKELAELMVKLLDKMER